MRRLEGGLLVALALACLAPAPLTAFAAPAESVERQYDIPPGPLGSALTRLSSDLNLLFSVDGRLIEGKHTQGLKGRYGMHAAFGALLEGTGLALVADGPRYTLRPLPAVPPPLPEQGLPPIHVRSGPWTEERYLAQESRGAVRVETPLIELPQSITPLTRDFIQDLSIQSMADLLRYVPGVGVAQGEGNRDTPVFRGISSTSDFLFDGIRDDVQYYRDFYNTERVEVLRGPNAMINGYGAPGGVINRIGKTPGWHDLRELSLQTGAWNNRRAALDWDQAIDESKAFRLNVMGEDSGGYRDYFQLRRKGINPVFAIRPTGDVLAVFGYEHFDDTRTADRGIPSYLGRPVDVNASTYFGNPAISVSRVYLDAFYAQLTKDIEGGGRLRTHFRRTSYDKFFQNVFPGSTRLNGGVLEVAMLAHNSLTTRTNTFNQTDLTLPFRLGSVQHTLLTGFELGRQEGGNRREGGLFNGTTNIVYTPVSAPLVTLPVTFRTSATDPNNASVARVAALFVQDQVRWSPQWITVFGLRHDRLDIDVRDFQQNRTLASRDRLWSPRAGIVYQPAPNFSLYGNYSIGYTPRAGELLSALTPSNQALRPEKLVNREAGAKWDIEPTLQATASAYQLDRTGVAVVDPSSPTQQLMLVDGQRTRGVELSLGGSWNSKLKTIASYAWQNSRVTASLSPLAPAGAVMPHVPRHAASIWNRYQIDRQWAAGLGASYRGSVYTSTDNTVQLPGYVRFDAALYFDPYPNFRAQINAENLLNRGYYAYAHSNVNITPGSPRAFRLTVDIRF